jgi:hypothetical protein
MPRLIKAPTVKTVTKDGECHVSIDLTINIRTDGKILESTSIEENPVAEDKVSWAIQDFSPKQKVKFGKQVLE